MDPLREGQVRVAGTPLVRWIPSWSLPATPDETPRPGFGRRRGILVVPGPWRRIHRLTSREPKLPIFGLVAVKVAGQEL